MSVRYEYKGSTAVLPFKVLQGTNLDACDLKALIDWEKEIAEPVFTENMSLGQLGANIFPLWNFLYIHYIL